MNSFNEQIGNPIKTFFDNSNHHQRIQDVISQTKQVLENATSSFYNKTGDLLRQGTEFIYSGDPTTCENTTELEYCQNKECTKATVASFFIGFPCFIIVSFCVIACLGFACSGVVVGSAAAACQSACYQGATGGCFSLFQSAGVGGCMGICFVIGILSIIGGLFSTATWFLCVFTCEKLNGNC